MKICIVGAGAIGGMLGVKLALSGHDVTLILRGANLQAVQQNGQQPVQPPSPGHQRRYDQEGQTEENQEGNDQPTPESRPITITSGSPET